MATEQITITKGRESGTFNAERAGTTYKIAGLLPAWEHGYPLVNGLPVGQVLVVHGRVGELSRTELTVEPGGMDLTPEEAAEWRRITGR